MPEDSTYRLRGWVKDEARNAVDRALVIGRALDGTVYSTLADDKGHFSLGLPSRDMFLTLRVSDAEGKRMFVTELHPRPSYTVKTIPDMRFPGADQIVSAILVPVIESKLLVVDADSQPVAGATVVVQDAMRDVDVLQTDAQGRATIRLPQSGQPMIMAFKSGVATTISPLMAATNTTNLSRTLRGLMAN
jgi:hypothetical protein